jgi:predicted nucleotidyltransferase
MRSVATLSGIDVPVERLAAVCRRFEVTELAVFGSAARGELRPDSDMDILVEFRAGHSSTNWSGNWPGFSAAKWIWCRRTA